MSPIKIRSFGNFTLLQKRRELGCSPPEEAKVPSFCLLLHTEPQRQMRSSLKSAACVNVFPGRRTNEGPTTVRVGRIAQASARTWGTSERSTGILKHHGANAIEPLVN